jgi:PhnB protein
MTAPAVQRATPMVSYEDVAAAIDWLGDAFGFRERGERFADDDGRVTHAQLGLDGAVVMVGWPGPDFRSPAHTPRSASRHGAGWRRRG